MQNESLKEKLGKIRVLMDENLPKAKQMLTNLLRKLGPQPIQRTLPDTHPLDRTETQKRIERNLLRYNKRLDQIEQALSKQAEIIDKLLTQGLVK